MTQHPDRLGPNGCDKECKAKWIRLTDAYTSIKDYHSGKLRLVGGPTRFED